MRRYRFFFQMQRKKDELVEKSRKLEKALNKKDLNMIKNL